MLITLTARFSFLLSSWPERWRRFFIHIFYIFSKQNYKNYPPATGFGEWGCDLLCYGADILCLPEIYETSMGFIKWKTRALTDKEIKTGITIFGNSIRWELVRIDDRARVGLNKNIIAYVSFNTINYSRKINNAILIHELMHVWQYQKFGTVYISKALKAQRLPNVYDYGGSEHLFSMMMKGKALTDFNFEQQAEIIEDYYSLLKNGSTEAMKLQLYQYYASQLIL